MRRVEVGLVSRPAFAHGGHQPLRLCLLFGDLFRVGDGVVVFQQRQRCGEEFGQRVGELQFVCQRQFDVDAFDAVGVVAQTRQRNHHVLIDLEGIGVRGDGGGAGAVEPEFLACFGVHRDETFAATQVGQLHDARGGFAGGNFVVRHHVDQQHHVRPGVLRRLGGVAHGLHIARVEVFQAGEQHVGMSVAVVLDFNDRWRGFARRAEEFQADGATVCRQAMQDEARRGDEAVTAFLLDAGQAGEEFVGNVLAEAGLAEAAAGNGEDVGAALGGLAVGAEAADFERGRRRVVNLAQVVVEAADFDPVGVGCDHLPRHQVVQRRAPQHRFFAAGIH